MLLTVEQRRKVEQMAARSSVSVGAVIRAVIDAYIPPASSEQRHRALDDLFALDAPVADWADMEAEIARLSQSPVGVDLGEPLETLVVHRLAGPHRGEPDTTHQLGSVLGKTPVAERPAS